MWQVCSMFRFSDSRTQVPSAVFARLEALHRGSFLCFHDDDGWVLRCVEHQPWTQQCPRLSVARELRETAFIFRICAGARMSLTSQAS